MNLSTHCLKLTVPVVQAINIYEYTVANRNLLLDTLAFLRLHGIDSYTLTEKTGRYLALGLLPPLIHTIAYMLKFMHILVKCTVRSCS
jgi:hypothetical protein